MQNSLVNMLSIVNLKLYALTNQLHAAIVSHFYIYGIIVLIIVFLTHRRFPLIRYTPWNSFIYIHHLTVIYINIYNKLLTFPDTNEESLQIKLIFGHLIRKCSDQYLFVSSYGFLVSTLIIENKRHSPKLIYYSFWLVKLLAPNLQIFHRFGYI